MPSPSHSPFPRPRLAAALLLVVALSAGALLVGAPASAQVNGCVADPNDGDDDRAEIEQFCVVEAAGQARFSLRVTDPVDPDADAGWSSADTFATWGVDGDTDGAVDHVVVFGIEIDGVLRGSVVNLATETETCIELDAMRDGPDYVVADVPLSCVGGDLGQSFDATIAYDTAPDSDGGVVTDRAPDTGLATPTPSSEDPVQTGRLAGETRFHTAVAIAQASFPDGAPTVYLARHDEFADAVAAGTLTAGPILLVPSCQAIPGVVTAELARLAPEAVVALGGTEAVCDDVLADAAAASGSTSRRLAGATRTETAIAIAGEAFPNGAAAAYLVGAGNPADAIAAGSVTDGPLLLVPACDGIPAALAAELDRLDPGRVVALGGEAAVCEATLTDAADAVGAQPSRIAGTDRIDTAAQLSGLTFPDGADTAYLARADVLADAVASGSLADGPVLLVPQCGAVPQAVTDAITALAPSRVVALGGEAAICPELLEEFQS